MYDLLIRGARIADGTGAPLSYGDVAVRDGVIAAINPAKAEAERVIEANGLVLAPGFIDVHSHHDTKAEEMPECAHILGQGVTTFIGGMCGTAPAPVSREHLQDCFRITGANHSPESIEARHSAEAYLARLRGMNFGSNMTFLIGHGNLRVAAMGFSPDPAGPEDLAKMQEILRSWMKAGALGVSFGLIYPPGSYSNTEELVAIARVVKEFDGVITAHMRDEARQLIEAVEEMLFIARETGVRTIISHHKACGGPENWNKTKQTIAMMQKAVDDGLDVHCDQYPYTASSNALKSTVPSQYHALGVEKMVELVSDPESRAAIRDEILEGKTPHDRFQFTMIGTSKSHPEYAGKMLNALADEAGVDPYDFLCDLLRDDQMTTRGVYHTMCEEDVERVMKWPRTMIGSDGNVSGKGGHPRTFSTFTRVLSRYVRERKVLPLEEAIHRMTGLPASVYRLSHKGVIAEGMDADLVLFDPDRIRDRSEYGDPTRGNEGYELVVVNGRIALEKDQVNGTLAGKAFFRDDI